MRKSSDPEGLAWLFFKINLLVAVLVVVIYASHVLSARGLPSSIAGFLGMPAQEQLNQNFKFNWCDTRVAAIDFGQGQRIYQAGYKWYRQESDGKATELNFLHVEKWFAENCKVSAQHNPKVGESNAVAAIIEFINGEKDMLKTGPENGFEWRSQSFRSADLAKALEEAKNLK